MSSPDIPLQDRSPTECLELLDETLGMYEQDDKPEAISHLQQQIVRVAEQSGNIGILEVARRGNKDEMLEVLRRVIVSNIVNKSFDL